nr:MAG: hypothetical protein [Jingmen bat rhabdovirus 2]
MSELFQFPEATEEELQVIALSGPRAQGCLPNVALTVETLKECYSEESKRFESLLIKRPERIIRANSLLNPIWPGLDDHFISLKILHLHLLKNLHLPPSLKLAEITFGNLQEFLSKTALCPKDESTESSKNYWNLKAILSASLYFYSGTDGLKFSLITMIVKPQLIKLLTKRLCVHLGLVGLSKSLALSKGEYHMIMDKVREKQRRPIPAWDNLFPSSILGISFPQVLRYQFSEGEVRSLLSAYMNPKFSLCPLAYASWNEGDRRLLESVERKAMTWDDIDHSELPDNEFNLYSVGAIREQLYKELLQSEIIPSNLECHRPSPNDDLEESDPLTDCKGSTSSLSEPCNVVSSLTLQVKMGLDLFRDWLIQQGVTYPACILGEGSVTNSEEVFELFQKVFSLGQLSNHRASPESSHSANVRFLSPNKARGRQSIFDAPMSRRRISREPVRNFEGHPPIHLVRSRSGSRDITNTHFKNLLEAWRRRDIVLQNYDWERDHCPILHVVRRFLEHHPYAVGIYTLLKGKPEIIASNTQVLKDNALKGKKTANLARTLMRYEPGWGMMPWTDYWYISKAVSLQSKDAPDLLTLLINYYNQKSLPILNRAKTWWGLRSIYNSECTDLLNNL